jgi:Tol biopolymer transport system component
MRSRRAGGSATTLAALVALAVALAGASQAAFSVKVASRLSNGHLANGDSSTEGTEQLSGDGNLYAFVSQAANLPGGDGSTYQAYVRNFTSGKTRLISAKPNGHPVSGGISSVSISADGRFVAFHGLGGGLPGSGTDSQVWIRNLKSGKTRLVSKAENGDPGSDSSDYPTLSADGRQVAFRSEAANLPGGDGTNEYGYVRDTKKGKTILVTQTSSGEAVPGNLYGQVISGDGRKVVFQALSADLPGGDGLLNHVYLRNIPHHHTSLIDHEPDGTPADKDSRTPSISSDGRFAVFHSEASNLPGGNGDQQAYVINLKTGKTKLVSRDSAGQPAEGSNVRISGNGHRVAFESQDADLPGGDGTTYQMYARNLKTGKTTLLSRASNGDPGDADSFYSSISRDGRFVGFEGRSENLGGDPGFENAFRAGPIG